jgi:hypothetical protein
LYHDTTNCLINPPCVSPLSVVTGVTVVLERACELFTSDSGERELVVEVFNLVDRLFAGKMWHYQPCDLKYHDYRHTLQAAYAYLDLVAAARGGVSPSLVAAPREAVRGLVAILLHDTGYLKAQGDDFGSGAKYTHCHVLRSCALAASIMPSLGLVAAEVEDVLGAIRCTGLGGAPSTTKFRDENARQIARLVGTADYLGQMADPDYPAKLVYLFNEFVEADDYSRIPPDKRMFVSSAQLLASTGGFWRNFVQPKFLEDFGGVYRYLAAPYPDGPNRYIEAIERNIAVISTQCAPSV